jgi:hypothetical protein
LAIAERLPITSLTIPVALFVTQQAAFGNCQSAIPVIGNSKHV